MDLRQLTPDFAVAPQITPDDMTRLAAMGYRTILNNRPDDEVDSALDHAAMQAAATAAGLAYHHLPYVPGMMTPDLVAAFEAALEQAEGKVLAYCRSGTRSSYLWAMAMAGRMDTGAIVAAARRAGYDHEALVPVLEAHAASRG